MQVCVTLFQIKFLVGEQLQAVGLALARPFMIEDVQLTQVCCLMISLTPLHLQVKVLVSKTRLLMQTHAESSLPVEITVLAYCLQR
jgi:hypothetical protein